MKVAILAGGMGTRLSEETALKPKPMVEIGGHPVLWHVMKIYASYGFTEFVIALGHQGEVIKDYFANYRLRRSSLTVNLASGEIDLKDQKSENWIVHLLDTGIHTATGGRIKQVAEFIGPETFMLTYGDAVCNINLTKLLEFHHQHKTLATVTAVRPPGRFGSILFEGNRVARFAEKPQAGEGWINGGFYVLEPAIAKYISGNDMPWESDPMETLTAEGQLSAYRHTDFWQCMDTLRDVRLLDSLWNGGNPPWRTWD